MSRMRWGDAEDDDDVLPEPTTVGPNDKGIITKTEYFKNAKGDAMKRVTKIQMAKVQTKVFEVSSLFTFFAVNGRNSANLVQNARAKESRRLECMVIYCRSQRSARSGPNLGWLPLLATKVLQASMPSRLCLNEQTRPRRKKRKMPHLLPKFTWYAFPLFAATSELLLIDCLCAMWLDHHTMSAFHNTSTQT
jgi:hypothetical protein